MEATSGVDLCRVTVVAPRTRMDLALPNDSPLADLLPTLLRFAGENPDDPAFLRGGWILQRLGEEAFDASQRLGNLGIRDGDVLHLRHREEGMPEFAFDDVADAIMTATQNKRAAWQPKDTRATSVLASGAFFVLATLLALTSGPPWIVTGAVTLAGAVALLFGGWAMSRASENSTIGAFLGISAIVYAGIGGLVIFAEKEMQPFEFGAVQFAIGMAFAFLFAVIAAIAIVVWWNGFVAAALAALIGGISAIALLLLGPMGVDAPEVAAVALAIAIAITPALPTWSAKFAGLPIPQLPRNSEDLRTQADVLPGPSVLQQALTADRMLAGFLGMSAAICVGASVYLAGDAGWMGPVLAGVTGLALLLRARHFRGRTQRLWLIYGGVLCVALLAVRLAFNAGGGSTSLNLVMFGLPCLAVGGALAAWAVSMSERRVSPALGRWTDILEVVNLLAVIPLAVGVLDGYERIQIIVSGI